MSNRTPATWADLEHGEFADELLAEVTRAMGNALEGGHRMEVEGRAHPDGEKDGQVFVTTFDVASQPPTPPEMIATQVVAGYRRGLGDDFDYFMGRIRINFRQKGNTRNGFGTFSKNIVPAPDDDDDEDFDGDFDDDGLPHVAHAPQQHVPHIPIQGHGAPHHAPGHQQSWNSPGHGNLPSIDMSGSGHYGPSAYERRRLAAREVGLNEPLSEFLMAPQWAAVTDLLGGHSDRIMRANLDMMQMMTTAFQHVVDNNTQITLRVLDNNAPTPAMQSDYSRDQANNALSVGMQLMKMMKAGGGKKKKEPGQLPAAAPAWGAGSADRAGDWNRPAFKVPEAAMGDFDEGDDFDSDEGGEVSPAPAPLPLDGGGGAATSLPATPTPRQLTAEDWAGHIRALAKKDPDAAKDLIISVKDDVAGALDIDPDLLDAFLEDDED